MQVLLGTKSLIAIAVFLNIHTKSCPGKHPSVFNHPDNGSVLVGRGVTFHCRASGKPKLRIKWKKDGVTVTQTERIKIRDGARGNSRLRIRNVQRSDSGYYSCLAKNRFGHDSSNRAYLHVRGK